MTTRELLIIALAVLVPAALLWAVFLARAGKPGKPGVVLGIPQALRPAPPDEVLEGPRLMRIQTWGLVATLAIALFIPAYWLGELQRQSSFQGRHDEESVERGRLIFSAAPPLEEDASPQEFKEEERAISLGMGCVNCHGGVDSEGVPREDAAGGALVPGGYNDPSLGRKVQYRGPPLQNVFQRWDEEIIRFTIERGRPGTPMPAWGVEYGGPMTQQMVDDVIAWLETLPGNQEPPPDLSEDCQKPSGNNLESCGQEIFEARCAVCHGPEGQGKEGKGTKDDPWYQGLALWKGDVRHLSQTLHEYTIRNGRRFAFMPPFAEAPAQGIPAPSYPLTDAQIRAVIAYERGL